MSKIEVCSLHTGEICGTTKAGREFSVVFEDKGACGVALVDEDIAEHLLGGIGHPEYFKAGAIEVKTTETAPPSTPASPATTGTGEGKTDPAGSGTGSDPSKPEDPPPALTIEAYDAITNAMSLKAAINKCESKETIMELIAHETQGKNRDWAVKALEERQKALGEQ